MKRRRLVISGVVQGVGFRPFVFSTATRLGLTGFVGNDSNGVFIEIEGEETGLDAFVHTLTTAPPLLAHIEHITTTNLAPIATTTFEIVHSEAQPSQRTLISPDISTCSDCLNEFFDPADRRYLYPFTNCTNCGPRFTIIQDIPYDRPKTTMASFPMCAACQAEYENPLDRRFHAQPNACPTCGPRIWLESTIGHTSPDTPPIELAQRLLLTGKVLAVKGLGGFHLACDATNDFALAILRKRKQRPGKPFALMAYNISSIRRFAHISKEEEQLLTSKERPIVLLRKRELFTLSKLIAPDNPFIGVMLPYTPLHYLLLAPRQDETPLTLVMTSGNLANEPIVHTNENARAFLTPLVDAILFHNRDIHARADDSVLRVAQHPNEPTALLPIRRSRGYAPFPVKLPASLPPILAVGGELKATFCLANAEHGFMSQHIGDMENMETLNAFEEAADHFETIFRVTPEHIACDLHPGYLSTQWAERNAHGRTLTKVQHHHAHIASVMAEHQISPEERVIGFSFDGTGYGTDGAIWGGETLICGYAQFERAYHLRYVPLVGGNIAVKRPYRLALAHLWAAGLPWDLDIPAVAACPEPERKIILRQLETGLNSPATSSMGRLFDAVAALIGVRQTVTYEAQAAMELEALAIPDISSPYPYTLSDGTIDPGPMLHAIVNDLKSGTSVPQISGRFHYTLVDIVDTISQQLRASTGIGTVALSGGVFQNVTLLQQAVSRLSQSGFTVLTHRLVPPNDGGLALGQAMVAHFSRQL